MESGYYTLIKKFLTGHFESNKMLPMIKNRRRQFLINKPLQIRFMAYVSIPLLAIVGISLAALYFGIWGSVLEAFSNDRLQQDLLTASRITEYEAARYPAANENFSTLRFFKQTEKLSRRQQEVFREILDESNRKILPKFLILLALIAWGSIYISHKTAGPLYRFHKTLEEMEENNFATRVYLRKFDESQPLANRFNEVLQHLDRTFSRIKNVLRENESNPERLVTRLKEELSQIKTSADS